METIPCAKKIKRSQQSDFLHHCGDRVMPQNEVTEPESEKT
jgi:hypothetical protein